MNIGKFEWAQVISSIALLVSLVNSYFGFLRRVPLKIRFGETLMLQVGATGRLRVKPEVMLYNAGSTLTVVHELSWRLDRPQDAFSVLLDWEENLTTVFTEEVGNRRTDTRFESFPGTLTVPSGDAVTKRMLLSTPKPFDEKAGNYVLSVSVKSEGTRVPKMSLSVEIRLNAEDVAFLIENKLAETNLTRKILVFRYDNEERAFRRMKRS